jgi:hypothetical protein
MEVWSRLKMARRKPKTMAIKMGMRNPMTHKMVVILVRNRRIWLMRAGSMPCPGAIWTLIKTPCIRAMHHGAPKGFGGPVI